MSLNDIDFRNFLKSSATAGQTDSAHDLAHIQRVVKNAELILRTEEADPETVIAAAWLHDCVTLPKNHPDRKKASLLAADKATGFLKRTSFPEFKIEQVSHAIEAHSYSAGIQAQTKEACIVQDADRLDALGAIGIARCFLIGGSMNRALYNPTDPFCTERDPDDTKWNIDHFYEKLLKLPQTMNTQSAKKEALRRADFMKGYLERLREEIE
jgi:uncharacterized protein